MKHPKEFNALSAVVLALKKAECANTQKKMAMCATWSEGSSEDDDDDYKALTSRMMTDDATKADTEADTGSYYSDNDEPYDVNKELSLIRHK